MLSKIAVPKFFMLNRQEIIKILLNASPVVIPWTDLESAILAQETVAENYSSKLSQETIDALIILQVLYYIRNGDIENSYLAVADVYSSQKLKLEVEENAAEIYLAYRSALPNPAYLLPSDSDDLKLLQAGIDGDKAACQKLAAFFESAGNEEAHQYWINRSAFELEIEFYSEQAEKVIVTGDFDGWSQSCVLEKQDGIFSGVIDTLLDTVVFRFVVDGEWQTSELYDTIMVDGNLCNVLNADRGQAKTRKSPGNNSSLTVLPDFHNFEVEYFSDTAKNVVITGDFDHWSQTCSLEKRDGVFTGIISTKLSSIIFRVIVDGKIDENFDKIKVDGVSPSILKAGIERFLSAEKTGLYTTAVQHEVKSSQESDVIAAENSINGTINEPLPEEQTVALIKPDAYSAGHKDEILNRILQAGFKIVNETELVMSLDQAMEFYEEHEGKPFYDNLIHWMSSAPIYAMVLEKNNAVKGWRSLAGPTNSNTARETAPESLRALYGTDGSQNAVHGSDSVNSALREKTIIFGYQQKVTDSETAEVEVESEYSTQETEQHAVASAGFPEDVIQSIIERSEMEEEARLSVIASDISESFEASASPTGISDFLITEQRAKVVTGSPEETYLVVPSSLPNFNESVQNVECLTGEKVYLTADENNGAVEIAKSLVKEAHISLPTENQELAQNVESLTGEVVLLSPDEVEEIENAVLREEIEKQVPDLPTEHTDTIVGNENESQKLSFKEVEAQLASHGTVNDIKYESAIKDSHGEGNSQPLTAYQVEEVLQNIESLTGEPVAISSHEAEVLKATIPVIEKRPSSDQIAVEDGDAEVAALIHSVSPEEEEKVMKSLDSESTEVEEVNHHLQDETPCTISVAEDQEVVRSAVENNDPTVIQQTSPVKSLTEMISEDAEKTGMADSAETRVEIEDEDEDTESLTPEESEIIQNSSRFVELALIGKLSDGNLEERLTTMEFSSNRLSSSNSLRSSSAEKTSPIELITESLPLEVENQTEVTVPVGIHLAAQEATEAPERLLSSQINLSEDSVAAKQIQENGALLGQSGVGSNSLTAAAAVNPSSQILVDHTVTAIPPSYDEAVSVVSHTHSDERLSQNFIESPRVEAFSTENVVGHSDEDLVAPKAALTANRIDAVNNSVPLVIENAESPQAIVNSIEDDEIIAGPSPAATGRQPAASPSMEIIPVSKLQSNAPKINHSSTSTGCCSFFS